MWRKTAHVRAARRALRPAPSAAKLLSSGSEFETTSGSEMESEEDEEKLPTKIASIFAGGKAPPKPMKRRKRSSLRASLTRRLHL
jgi:hypothetical protein